MVSMVLPSKPFPSMLLRNPKKPLLRSPSSSSHSFVTRKMKFALHAEKNQRKREGALVAHRHPPVLDVILHIKVVDQKWLAQLGISNCLIQGES